MHINKLIPFIPEKATHELEKLLEGYIFNLKIVNGRKTKRGDFRATTPNPTITINNNLSKEQFLITLIHEIAHLDVFLNTPQATAHGTVWKNTFKILMLPFLNLEIFPNHILSPLANYLINPKASTDSYLPLAIALKQLETTAINHQKFIHQLQINDCFTFQKKRYILLEKRRTKYICKNTTNNQQYLISAHAVID